MSRYQVKCRRCRQWLMSEDSVVDCHGDKVQGDITHWDCGSQLGETTRTHLFVSSEDAPPFVLDPITESGYTQGKILCPKCNGRLGSFDFLRTTRYCPCRLTTLPPVHLLHDRLDVLDCRQRHKHIVSHEAHPSNTCPVKEENRAGSFVGDVEENLEKRKEFMCKGMKLDKQDLLHKDVGEQIQKRTDLVFTVTEENLEDRTHIMLTDLKSKCSSDHILENGIGLDSPNLNLPSRFVDEHMILGSGYINKGNVACDLGNGNGTDTANSDVSKSMIGSSSVLTNATNSHSTNDGSQDTRIRNDSSEFGHFSEIGTASDDGKPTRSGNKSSVLGHFSEVRTENDDKDMRITNESSMSRHFSDVGTTNPEGNEELVSVSSLSELKTNCEGTENDSISQTSADLEHNTDRTFSEESCLHSHKSCSQRCDCVHLTKSQPLRAGLTHTQGVSFVYSENCGLAGMQNTGELDSTKTNVQPDSATHIPQDVISQIREDSNDFAAQTSHKPMIETSNPQNCLLQLRQVDGDIATHTTLNETLQITQVTHDLATQTTSSNCVAPVSSNPQNELLQVGQITNDPRTQMLAESNHARVLPLNPQVSSDLATQTSTISNSAMPPNSDPTNKIDELLQVTQVSTDIATETSTKSDGALPPNADPTNNIDELLQVTQVSTDLVSQSPTGVAAPKTHSINRNQELAQTTSSGVNSGRFSALANLGNGLLSEDGNHISESSHHLTLPTSKKLIHKKPSRIIVSSSSSQRRKRVRRRRITDDDIDEDYTTEDISSSSAQQSKRRVRRRRLTDDNLDEEEDSDDNSYIVGVDGNVDVALRTMGVCKHGRYLKGSHHQKEQEKRERQLTEERELEKESVLWDHSCPMCLEVMWKPHTTLPCRHHFCEACLRHLTSVTSSTKSDCPLCRQRIAQCLPNADLEETIREQYPAHIRIRQRDHRRNQRYKHTPLPGLGFPHNVLSRLPRNASLSSTCKRRVMMLMLNMVIVAALSYIGMAICGRVLRYLADFYDSVTERLTGERLWSGFMGLESRMLTASCVFVLYLVCACMTQYFRLFQHIQN